MALLSFDENSKGCSLPPFNAVSNSLFFFRVNVFEQFLPPGVATPDDQAGIISPAQPPTGVARLGVPITDIFPNLLPEFAPSLPTIGRAANKVRLRQGIFLPAASLNKTYMDAKLVTATAGALQAKRLAIGDRHVNLSDDKLSELAAGNPVTLTADGSLVRVLPPPQQFAAEPAPAPFGFLSRAATTPIVPGAPFSSLSTLSDAQFEALCFALFDELGASRVRLALQPRRDFACQAQDILPKGSPIRCL